MSIGEFIASPSVSVIFAAIVVIGVEGIVLLAFRTKLSDAATFPALKTPFFLPFSRVSLLVEEVMAERYGCLVRSWLLEPLVVAFVHLCLRWSIYDRTSDTS